MKTVLNFTESCFDNRKLIIYHNSDVKITKEIRKDHIEWFDVNGNVIENRQYIIIRFPKTKKVDFKNLKLKYQDKYSLGYLFVDLADEIELLFYDQIHFAWRANNLEEMGLFDKVRHRIIPNWKDNGELFPFYINASGVREFMYNIVFGIIQLPFVIFKKNKNAD